MNISFPARLTCAALALLLALTGAASAQPTFTFTTTGLKYQTGAADPTVPGSTGGGTVSSGTAYSTAPGTSITFGQNFDVFANGSSTIAGTAAWYYNGTSTGGPIVVGSHLPILWNFDLSKNIFVAGNVDWVLFFQGGSNAATQVASGTLSSASQTFTGSTTYDYLVGANASDTFQAYLGVSFISNVGPGQGDIGASMVNGGLGGPGITISPLIVPEPSTYAAIAGAVMLGFTVWRRRR